jgi:hypothetical protein
MMEPTDRNSFLLLFCALLLVRQSRMKLQDLVLIYPFTGEAQSLAQMLSGAESVEALARKANC